MANLGNLTNNVIIGPSGLINNNTLNNNPVIGIAQGVKLGNTPIGNPGFISGEQLATFFVGNVVGATKQAIYNIGIKNTELLSQKVNFTNSPTNPPNGPFFGPEEQIGTRQYEFSELGTPIFDFVRFQPVTYYSFTTEKLQKGQIGSVGLDTRTTVKPIEKQFGGIDFVTCMVDVSKAIDIVETKTAGSIQGTIKEYMGSSEWSISLTAYVTPQNMYDNSRIEYNVDVLNELKKIPEINNPIPVESRFLNLLGITHVVPTDVSLRPVEGMVGVIQVEFTLLSDSQIIPKA
jgi:hypothetical protein